MDLLKKDSPLVDLYFLADWTGSMSTAMANVRANLYSAYENFISKEEPTWDTAIGLGAYADTGDGTRLFQNLSGITKCKETIESASSKLRPSGGGDTPEAQAYALTWLGQTSNHDAIGWRPSATRFVVWFGDEPGHNPVTVGHKDYTFDEAIKALTHVNVRVLAFSVAPSNELDKTNQATKVTNKTNGVTDGRYLMSDVKQKGVIEFIFDSIKSEVV